MTGHRGTLLVSERFQSIQGEGPSAGAPRAFLRLAGCNLHCNYCDTKFTWDWRVYDKRTETSKVEIEALLEWLADAPGVVVTGGEPLLQQSALVTLLSSIPKSCAIEVETNGTIYPHPALVERVNQWNVSPKLSFAGDPESERLVGSVLTRFASLDTAWLKCVVQSPVHVAEVEEIARRYGWPSGRVLLQPQAITREQLLRESRRVTTWCREVGLRFSPRLQVALWESERRR